MIALQGQPGELRFTLEITRKATGKVETIEMVGHIQPAPPTPEQQEPQDVSHPLDGGA
jgi:hypothetical protein